MAILVILSSGCKKLEQIPEDKFTDGNYWTTPAKANSILNTAYSQMFKSDYFFSNEAMSDNAYNGRGDAEGAASLAAGTYDAALDRLKNEWRYHYEGIKTCNLILQNIDRVSTLPDALKNRMKAEARFLRAFQYFQLMTWFGDVPLLKNDISIDEALNISRAPKAEVLSFILAELNDCAAVLPVNTAYDAADRGRITRGAVIALKARIMLYEGSWQEVINACEALMGNANGTYDLFSSYEGLFLQENEFNPEVVLDVQYVPELRTWGNFFDLLPLSVGGRLNVIAPTQELVDSYLMINGKKISEAGANYDENDPYKNRDPRLANTVVYHLYPWKKDDGSIKTIYTKPGTDPDKNKPDEYSPGSSASPTGYYLRKYYDPKHGNNFSSGLNMILIRYADVLLMYAEAKAELGQMNEAVWNQTIRRLRARAGFTDPAALSFNAGAGNAEQVQVIRNERRTELAMEGLRIFDIRRWKIAENVLNGWAHGAQFGTPDIDNGYIRANQRSFDKAKHYLWPVPRDERQLNPNLGQNSGW